MRVSIILAHPQGGSFCHALADAAHAALVANGHAVHFHDLYRESFPALLTAPELDLQRSNHPLVERHCEEIVKAEGLVVVHPNWWSQPPAILKGWLDRVLRPGVAYGLGAGSTPQGLLGVKAAVIVTTAATTHEDEVRRYGDPLDTLWRKCILGVCGVTNVRRIALGGIDSATPEVRGQWIVDVETAMQETFNSAARG